MGNFTILPSYPESDTFSDAFLHKKKGILNTKLSLDLVNNFSIHLQLSFK